MSLFEIAAIGIAALTFICVGIVYAASTYPSLGFMIGLMSVGCATGLFVGVVFPGIVFADASKVWSETSAYKIVSIANASEIEGSGSLLGSNVDEKNVYRYFTEDGDGALELQEMDANGVLIKEDATTETARISQEDCHYELKKKEPSNKSKSSGLSLTVGTVSGSGIWSQDSLLTICGSRTVVHLPKGAVVPDFLLTPGGQR